jgi:hypothetical protein
LSCSPRAAPCLISYALGACGQFWLTLGQKVLCCFNCKCTRKTSACICFQFEDSEFPATGEGWEESIGPWKSPEGAAAAEWKKKVGTDIEFKRGNDICKVPRPPPLLLQRAIPCWPHAHGRARVLQLAEGEHMRLFSGKIEPADIGQGQLGDCWLMTALACLSEFPGAIQSIFETVEYNGGQPPLRSLVGALFLADALIWSA